MSNVVEAALGPAKSKAGTTNKPSIEVDIRGHYNAKVYTSGSHVSGHIIINCQRDTPFEAFEVLFTGTSATRLDFVQSYTTNSVRTFMKLRMPIPESDLPESRVFQAGRTYKIPFHFVVPFQLTMGACAHGCAIPAVQDQHLRLPPTIGYWEGEDQAPDMTHVEYAVKAKFNTPARTGEPKSTPVEGKKIVKVLPASPEEPPLDITRKDERYCLSKTKTFRKNLLGVKAGELTATSDQPEAIMLKADLTGASGTTAKINLEFAPAAIDSAPPKVNSVAGKIVATTFFSSNPANSLPNLGPKTTYSHNQVLTYSATTNLFNNRVDKVSWSKCRPSLPRRDSGYASEESPEEYTTESDSEGLDNGRRGSKSKSKKPQGPAIRHRASLDIPVNVPISNKKIFVPTFHNCLISRAYTLQLVLSVGPANTTMTLNVPVQLGVEKRFDLPDEELPSFESAMAQAEEDDADAYLRPRIIQIPQASLQDTSTLPGYERFRQQAVAVA